MRKWKDGIPYLAQLSKEQQALEGTTQRSSSDTGVGDEGDQQRKHTMMLIMTSQLSFCLPLVAMILSTYQATSAQQSDPCYNYTVLNDTWRSTTNTDQSVIRCDGTALEYTAHWQGWYLLVHQDHSVRMPESCVPTNRCGTHGPIWMNGLHPSPADGVVTRQLCVHWDSSCCNPSYPVPSIQIKACPGNYIVYKFVDTLYCRVAYCADFSSKGALPSPTKHVVGVRLQVSSAERLNETAVEEQILKPLRDLLRQRGVDVSGIRLRRLVEKQP
ncbi:hypothetical protein ACEWY4_002399 [Coilia grayii]|uniref:UMOD/GP2/OIT3-like D8C domain-containing protein n=1 Tax=Coilia grayii TaxID=363190 RepID=A0ABD1KPA3_9TELE